MVRFFSLCRAVKIIIVGNIHIGSACLGGAFITDAPEVKTGPAGGHCAFWESVEHGNHFGYCGHYGTSSGKYLLVVVSKVRHIRITMGALERLNLALKILTGRHVPTRSEIESLKSSLRVASQMSAKEIASAVIHQELSRNRALRTGGAKGRR